MRFAGKLLILLALAGCGDPSAREAAFDGVLRVGNGGEPKSLDPHVVTGVIEEHVLSALFEGLVNLDYATLEAVPGVAERWEVSPDARIYTFHINPVAKWSNGDPVTAADFVYAWRRILSPALAAEYAYMLYPILNAEAFNKGDLTDFGEVGVSAQDDRTLEVTLRSPTPYFLALHVHFTFYPVHPPTIEAHDAFADRNAPWTRPGAFVGNGPFRLADWRPNDRIVVERSDTYWDRANVALEGIELYPVANPAVEERMFRAGDLHMTYALPVTKVAAYQNTNPDALRVDPFLAVEFLRFNSTRPPFDDARVRRALGQALDRQAITSNVLRGGEQPAYHFVPPHTAGYTSDYRVVQDPEQARALLAEAGYPGGKGFPKVELLFNTGENFRLYCEAVQQMWKRELGIEVALQNIDHKTWLANMIDLNYDIARSYWVGDYVDPGNFLEMFYANSGNNRTGFADGKYESLIREAAVTADQVKRHGLYRRAEALLLESGVVAPVYFHTRTYLLDPQVRNLPPNPLGRIPWGELRYGE